MGGGNNPGFNDRYDNGRHELSTQLGILCDRIGENYDCLYGLQGIEGQLHNRQDFCRFL